MRELLWQGRCRTRQRDALKRWPRPARAVRASRERQKCGRRGVAAAGPLGNWQPGKRRSRHTVEPDQGFTHATRCAKGAASLPRSLRRSDAWPCMRRAAEPVPRPSMVELAAAARCRAPARGALPLIRRDHPALREWYTHERVVLDARHARRRRAGGGGTALA